jgi:hypothetical protein
LDELQADMAINSCVSHAQQQRSPVNKDYKRFADFPETALW